MENQTKKNHIKKIVVGIILFISLSVLLFNRHLNRISEPNIKLGRICEEKIAIGMNEDEVFEILGKNNFRSKVEGQKAIYYNFYPENAPPSIIDTYVVISLKENKVVEKNCYSD